MLPFPLKIAAFILFSSITLRVTVGLDMKLLVGLHPLLAPRRVGRATTTSASTDATLNAATIVAIGNAVCCPPRPANGAITPAITHCRKPSRADPVPGRSGTTPDASAPAL